MSLGHGDTEENTCVPYRPTFTISRFNQREKRRVSPLYQPILAAPHSQQRDEHLKRVGGTLSLGVLHAIHAHDGGKRLVRDQDVTYALYRQKSAN